MAKKAFVCCLLFVFLLAGCSAPQMTDAMASVKPTERFFVNDFANVIDENTENAIYAAGVQLYEKTGAQVVVVTLNTIGGADVHEYTVELGREWGVGSKDKNDGIVLLLAMEERQINISVGYGLEGAVTDMQSGILIDRYALPHFEENDYSSGLAATYDALVNEVYLEYGMQADPNYVPVSELESDGAESPITWIGLVVLLLIISLLMRRTRGAGFFFFPMGGFHHHHGGGGFGGGGGFRGGGGSFGGGGASRGF